MYEIWIITRKNLKLIFDSKKSILQFVVPIVVLLAFMKLLSIGSSPIKIGVIDKDKTTSSNMVIESLKKVSFMNTVGVKDDGIKQAMLQRDIVLGITIPKGYEEGIVKQSPLTIELSVGEDNSMAEGIRSILNIKTRDLLDLSKASNKDKEKYSMLINEYKTEKVNISSSFLQDISSQYETTEISMGFLIFYLMIRAVGISGIILKERENNTYARIFMSPVGSFKYLLGNIVANLIVLFTQVVIMLLSLQYIFKINTGVKFVPMMLLLMLIILVAISFGILCVALFENMQVYSTISNLIITGTSMFSGSFVPIKMLPESVQKVSFFTPQRWVMDGIQKMQLGMETKSLTMNFIVLLSFSLAFFLIAVYKMRSSQKSIIAINS